MDKEVQLYVNQTITKVDMTVTPQDEFLYQVLRRKYDEYLFTYREVPMNVVVGYEVFDAVFKMKFNDLEVLNYDYFNGIPMILLQNVEPDFIEYAGMNKHKFVRIYNSK